MVSAGWREVGRAGGGERVTARGKREEGREEDPAAVDARWVGVGGKGSEGAANGHKPII